MSKISIIGCGKLGSTIAFSLLPNKKVDELVLVDIVKTLSDGLTLDLSHAYPNLARKLKSGKFKDTENSDIIIITAGKSRFSGTRNDLLATNKEIVRDVMKKIKVSDKTIIIVVTNPVESLTYLVYKLSGLSSVKVIGFSNILDSNRLCYVLSKKTGIEAEKIKCYVIGEHGENMLPVYSECFIDGKKIEEYKLDTEEITKELRDAAMDVINLVGATQYGPARHIINLVNAILNDTEEVFPVSFFVKENKNYNLENVSISVPVKVNREGVGEIVNLNLNDKEKESLQKIALNLKRIQNGLDV